MLLLQVTQAVADSLQVAADNLDQAIANADGLDKLSLITQQLLECRCACRCKYLKGDTCFHSRSFPCFDVEQADRPDDG